MTDNEIIKAKELLEKLRDAYNAYYDTSRSMPYDIDTTLRETAICLENSIDLINRQKAEIARYKRYYFNHEYDKWEREIKVQAVKEFAERLKEKYHSAIYFDVDDIDNLLKEMVGEE